MSFAGIYGTAAAAMVTGLVDVGVLKAMLTDDTYIPDAGADQFRADVSGEITGTGYTAGGIDTPATATYDVDAKLLTVALDDPPDFTGLVATGIRRLVFYVDTGSSATDQVVSWIDFEEDLDATAGFAPAMPATGLLSVSVLT